MLGGLLPPSLPSAAVMTEARHPASQWLAALRTHRHTQRHRMRRSRIQAVTDAPHDTMAGSDDPIMALLYNAREATEAVPSARRQGLKQPRAFR
ncbi:hypothetical protein MCHLDSM_03824 [Mycolicibacterium chlorophenolicum]|uniref:Uncharacterized protein n=1 Tax=Mycolicibacterium chlorophenolicum TaxID=37916 RepID=A0A0J6VVF0_9MYCO|nr:hypothetical protein MCHLDSM_03824 [Mycolicibacterium chlorophenolicum]